MQRGHFSGEGRGAGAPVSVGVGLVAGARLPLAFIGLGLGALALAVAFSALRPDVLLLPHLHPWVVALAHLWLPGFLLSVCFGAIYQLMPVVLGAPLQLPLAVAWGHLGLHAAGVALLVGGFGAGRFELVAAGGGAVTLGAGVLLAGTWRTFREAKRRDAIAWSFPVAVSWLAVTLLFGVVLALNRRAPFLPWSVVDLLRAHAHVGLAGFFLTLLQGATFQLVPMFTMAELRGAAGVRAGFGLTQVGLLLLIPGLAAGNAWLERMGALLVAAGVACSGVALVATLRGRRRRVLDPGLKAFGVGAALVAVAVSGGLGLLLLPGTQAWAMAAASAYGVVLIAGALSFMILGMLCKIIPFLVWMRTYGPRVGRQPVPLATALGSRTLEHAWLGLHGASLIALIGGVLWAVPVMVAVGAGGLALATGVFLANVARIGAHLFRPQTGAAPLPRVTPSPL